MRGSGLAGSSTSTSRRRSRSYSLSTYTMTRWKVCEARSTSAGISIQPMLRPMVRLPSSLTCRWRQAWPAGGLPVSGGVPVPEGPAAGRRAATGVPDRAGAREERTGLAGAGVALGWEKPARARGGRGMFETRDSCGIGTWATSVDRGTATTMQERTDQGPGARPGPGWWRLERRLVVELPGRRPASVGLAGALDLGGGPLQAGADLVGLDLGRRALVTLGRLPRAHPQPSHDDAAGALGQGLGDVLGELPPDVDPEERGLPVLP